MTETVCLKPNNAWFICVFTNFYLNWLLVKSTITAQSTYTVKIQFVFTVVFQKKSPIVCKAKVFSYGITMNWKQTAGGKNYANVEINIK